MSTPQFSQYVQAALLLAASLMSTCVFADGPQDNLPDNVRRIPKLGVEVPAADAEELRAGLESLAKHIETLRQQLPTEPLRSKLLAFDPKPASLLADVQIYHRAVDQALTYHEFFDVKEIPVAKQLLATGAKRAADLLTGEAPWTKQTGLVVRGYVSAIDLTVQPYGLVIPENYASITEPLRCDIWMHGRGEVLSELSFIQGRQTQKGEFTPENAIVLHPYGRYCNANKFAGEIDVLEGLAAVQSHYRINPKRVVVRGFSMGGASTWQLAVHYPGRWMAANPGAGFAETKEFLNVFQNEKVSPPWWEQKLWKWYDATEYAANFAFLPLVAYSGDMDKQKQAADIMEQALKAENLPMIHVIGPMTAHKIHPDSKIEIEKLLATWDKDGPPYKTHPPFPTDAGWNTFDLFVTPTLRYNQGRYITLTGLAEHWEMARVTLQRQRAAAESRIRVMTRNVTSFELRIPQAEVGKISEVTVDGRPVTVKWAASKSDGIDVWSASFHRSTPGEWTAEAAKTPGLAKVPGLQGPIDDAFLSSFLFVKPSQPGASPDIDKWVQAEFDHAVTHWRRHFRGDARVKLDSDVTADDIANSNLVLWGDAKSNQVLAKINDKLPISWTAAGKQLTAGETKYDAATHLPLLIFPNPLNPRKYVVLNSSFTFREYDYLNNARQTPKLPDWVIIDARTPANSRYPGKIIAADFFDETWKLKPLKKD